MLVVFSAPWCGPCKILVQRLEGLLPSLSSTGVRAVKLDTDTCPELATSLRVHKLPTVFFLGCHAEQGRPAACSTGLLPEAVLRDMVVSRSAFLGADLERAVSV